MVLVPPLWVRRRSRLTEGGACEVDSVRSNYTITFSRRKADNVARRFAVAKADTPGGSAEDTPHEGRHHNHRVRQGAPRRLRPFCRACKRYSEVAGGDGPVNVLPAALFGLLTLCNALGRAYIGGRFARLKLNFCQVKNIYGSPQVAGWPL